MCTCTQTPTKIVRQPWLVHAIAVNLDGAHRPARTRKRKDQLSLVRFGGDSCNVHACAATAAERVHGTQWEQEDVSSASIPLLTRAAPGAATLLNAPGPNKQNLKKWSMPRTIQHPGAVRLALLGRPWGRLLLSLLWVCLPVPQLPQRLSLWLLSWLMWPQLQRPLVQMAQLLVLRLARGLFGCRPQTKD